MKQLDLIIKAFKKYGGRTTYDKLYKEIANMKGIKELEYGQKAGIRKLIEDYSSDSKNYKNIEDLFKHYGRGDWGLRK